MRHLPCKAWADKGFVYGVRARIFSNRLYVQNLHLTEAKHIQKECYTRTLNLRVRLKDSDRETQQTWRLGELTGYKPTLVT
jgi:hypothetical protein